MRQRFVFKSMIVLISTLVGIVAHGTAGSSSPQNETPFQIFETQVYPFLQQKCAGCHGDNQFDAPQHSPRNDAQTSYQKIRGYVHIAPDWEKTSRLITFGGTRHCKEYTGDDSCGTDHNELISTVRNWINAEISARAETPQKQIRSAKQMIHSSQEKITAAEAKRSLKIVQISSGAYHTCALFENGRAKCWGENNSGQLGIGEPYDKDMSSLPYIRISEPIKQISAGNEHTCALLQSGRAKCWGRNYFGQLGIGTKTENVGINPQEMDSLPYVRISEPIKQISAGNEHTCALLQNGRAKCWGENFFGQLGIGILATRVGKTPQEMDSLPYVIIKIKEPIQQISAGGKHTCVLLQNGKAKCWGANLRNELGSGSKNIEVKTLSEMYSLPDVIVNEPILQISAGARYTCALLQSGKAKCWGINEYGKLGIGKIEEYISNMQSLPYVIVDEPIQQIVAGRKHTCALLQSGKAKCWGTNDSGQLGIGTNELGFGQTLDEMKNLPFVTIHQKILQISSSGDHTCFLLENNKIKCAGQNSYGQLGTGDTTNRGTLDIDGTDELPDALVSAEEE